MPTSVSTRTSGSLNPTRQQLDELDALLKRMLELPVNQLEEAEKAESEVEPEEPADEPPPPAAPVVQAPEPEPAMPPASPPVSYMVVETASPRPLPPASGFEPRPSPMTPRLMPMAPPEDDAEEEPEPSLSVDPQDEAEEPAEPEVWVPLRSTWQPSAQTWQPLAESWHQANGTAAPPNSPPETMPREIVLTRPAIAPAPLPVESMQRSTQKGEEGERTPSEMTGETALPSSVPPPAAPVAVEARLSLTAEDAPVVVPRALLPLVWFNQGFDACVTPLGKVGRWLSGNRGRQTLGIAGLACLAIALAIALSTGMAWTR